MNKLNIEQLQIVKAKPRVFGSRVGRITELVNGSIPVVDYAGNPLGPQVARLVTAMVERLALAHSERTPILLIFEEDDPAKPVIVDTVVTAAVPIGRQLDAHPPNDPGILGSADAIAREAAPLGTSHGSPSGVAAGIELPGSAEAASLAVIAGVEEDAVLIRLAGAGESPIKAKTAVALRNLKDPVVVLRLANQQPIIVGQIHDRVPIDPAGGEGAEVVLKGARVRIEAEVELILKAGSCSLHFDARGKAVTSADQIVSRARDTNKVQGGSVQLN